MRMNWKLPVYFGALALALTATVVSCSKDSTAPQGQSMSADARVARQKTQDTQASNKWAGKYHTDALEYVYSKLAQTNRHGTKAEKCRVAVAALKEFDKSVRKDGKSTAFVSDDVCGPPGSTGDVPEFGESVTSFAGTGFSPVAASILDQIQSVTKSYSSSSSVESAVTGLQNSAAAKLNPSEAAAVAALGSVAISSAQYWESNAEKWRALSPGPGVIRKQINATGADGAKSPFPARPRALYSSYCCEGIAAADISTFASAILQGWFLGAFDLEQAAYRAAVASMIQGLRQLFK